MEDRHHQARQLHMDGRDEKTRERQRLVETVSCRLQSYFVTLRRKFPHDADAVLLRAEQLAPARAED